MHQFLATVSSVRVTIIFFANCVKSPSVMAAAKEPILVTSSLGLFLPGPRVSASRETTLLRPKQVDNGSCGGIPLRGVPGLHKRSSECAWRHTRVRSQHLFAAGIKIVNL